MSSSGTSRGTTVLVAGVIVLAVLLALACLIPVARCPDCDFNRLLSGGSPTSRACNRCGGPGRITLWNRWKEGPLPRDEETRP